MHVGADCATLRGLQRLAIVLSIQKTCYCVTTKVYSMKTKRYVLLHPAIVVLSGVWMVGAIMVGQAGCGDGDGGAGQQWEDASLYPDSAAPDVGGPDSGTETPWDQHDWQPVRSDGDPQGDCQTGDVGCTADLAQLFFAVEQGVLFLDLRFHVDFPVDHGSFEIFLIPPDQQIVGHSVQVMAGDTYLWDADCRSVAGLQKHNGCHWSLRGLPSSLQAQWLGADRYVLEVELEELGFAALSELRVGVGAAPFEIQVTAEYTDRYPDQVWVTSTEIQGLQTISLAL